MRRWRAHRAVFLTVLYIVMLGGIPAYFGHQACRPAARGRMDWFLAGLDWVNCHLRFQAQDRTLEAYAAWLAAVFASVASYWAWRSFHGISDQVEEQRKSTFLSVEAQLYDNQLNRVALFLNLDLDLAFQGLPKEPTDNPVRCALSRVRELTRPSYLAQGRSWAAASQDVASYLDLARDYADRHIRSGVRFLPTEPWFVLLKKLEFLRSPRHSPNAEYGSKE